MTDQNRLLHRCVVLVQSEPCLRTYDFNSVVILSKLECIIAASPHVLNPHASSDVMVLILNSTCQLSRTYFMSRIGTPPPFSCVVLKKKFSSQVTTLIKRILHFFFGFLQNFQKFLAFLIAPPLPLPASYRKKIHRK